MSKEDFYSECILNWSIRLDNYNLGEDEKEGGILMEIFCEQIIKHQWRAVFIIV